MKSRISYIVLAFLAGMAISALSTYLLMKEAVDVSYTSGYLDGSQSQSAAIAEHEQDIYTQGYFAGYYDADNGLGINASAAYDVVESK